MAVTQDGDGSERSQVPPPETGDAVIDVDHLLTALRALMDISEAETGIMKLDRAPISLDQLATDVHELYAHVAEEAGIGFTLNHDERAIVTADAMRMRQAIANLVDNAIKYTPPRRCGDARDRSLRISMETNIRKRGVTIAPSAIVSG